MKMPMSVVRDILDNGMPAKTTDKRLPVKVKEQVRARGGLRINITVGGGKKPYPCTLRVNGEDLIR